MQFVDVAVSTVFLFDEFLSLPCDSDSLVLALQLIAGGRMNGAVHSFPSLSCKWTALQFVNVAVLAVSLVDAFLSLPCDSTTDLVTSGLSVSCLLLVMGHSFDGVLSVLSNSKNALPKRTW